MIIGGDVMATMFDRMTVNWAGERECETARKFRLLVGAGGISPKLKELAAAVVLQHEQTAMEQVNVGESQQQA